MCGTTTVGFLIALEVVLKPSQIISTSLPNMVEIQRNISQQSIQKHNIFIAMSSIAAAMPSRDLPDFWIHQQIVKPQRKALIFKLEVNNIVALSCI